jgi:hypothetical protein
MILRTQKHEEKSIRKVSPVGPIFKKAWQTADQLEDLIF